MILRKEINLLDAPFVQTSTTTLVVSTEKRPFSIWNYGGTVSLILEFTYTNTVASGTVQAGLSSSDWVTLSNSQSTFTTIRANLNSSQYQSTTELQLLINPLPAAGTVTLKAAKLIILQDFSSEVIQTLTTIEVGSNEGAKTLGTASVVTPLAQPKYWKYDSSKWNGNLNFTVYVWWKVSSTTGNKSIWLQEDNGSLSSWTSIATIVNASSGTTGGTLSSISFTPTTGRHYRIAWTNSSTMTSVSIMMAVVTIGQLPPGDGLPYAGLGANVISGSGGLGEQYAQSITPSSSFTTDRIALSLYRSGTTADTHTIELRSGSPTGTLLASATFDPSTITANNVSTGKWYVFPLSSSVSLTSGTKYVIVLYRSGLRDASNAINWNASATAYAGGGSFTMDNGVWGAESTSGEFLAILCNSASKITKGQDQYLLANAALAAGTALQSYKAQWLSSDWTAMTTSIVHQVDASASNTSVVEVDTAAGVQLTGSSVSSPNNVGYSGSVTMPTNSTTASRLGFFQIGNNTFENMGTTITKVAQSFKAAYSGTLKTLGFTLNSAGTEAPAGNITVSIYSFSGHFGTDVTVSGSPISTATTSPQSQGMGGEFRVVTMPDATITKGSLYIVVLEYTSTNAGYIQIGKNTMGIIPGAAAVYNGSSWSDPGYEFGFTVQGDVQVPTATEIDVKATTNSGNIFASRLVVDWTTDTTAPATPTGLAQVSVTTNSFTVEWSPTTDSVGVTAYNISVDGVAKPEADVLSTTVTGLSPNTTYSVAIRARDAAGNYSAYSTPISITTNALSGGGTVVSPSNFFVFF